jgi:hypothetical protein
MSARTQPNAGELRVKLAAVRLRPYCVFRVRGLVPVAVLLAVTGGFAAVAAQPKMLTSIMPAQARRQPPIASFLETRVEREMFLAKAAVATNPPADGRPSWRARLDDGSRQHDASVETADGSDPTRRNYKFNVAAYELDKLLGLDLVPPVVERLVGGKQA